MNTFSKLLLSINILFLTAPIFAADDEVTPRSSPRARTDCAPSMKGRHSRAKKSTQGIRRVLQSMGEGEATLSTSCPMIGTKDGIAEFTHVIIRGETNPGGQSCALVTILMGLDQYYSRGNVINSDLEFFLLESNEMDLPARVLAFRKFIKSKYDEFPAATILTAHMNRFADSNRVNTSSAILNFICASFDIELTLFAYCSTIGKEDGMSHSSVMPVGMLSPTSDGVDKAKLSVVVFNGKDPGSDPRLEATHMEPLLTAKSVCRKITFETETVKLVGWDAEWGDWEEEDSDTDSEAKKRD